MEREMVWEKELKNWTMMGSAESHSTESVFWK